MNKEDRQLIEKILNDLKKIKEVKAIYLFGSYARNQQIPISDIDICVITNKISDRKETDIVGNSGRRLDISLFSRLPIMIRSNVFKEGKLLFCRDKRLLIDLKYNTMSEYLDFRPAINRLEEYYKGHKWKE